MKYLKLFESVDTPYEEINSGQFLSYLYGDVTFPHMTAKPKQFASDNWVDFTQKELDQIRSCIPNDIVKLYTTRIYDINRDIIFAIDVDDSFYIYKLRDEWYYLQNSDNIRMYRTYYRCDQFDGLLQCLSDIKNKTERLL